MKAINRIDIKQLRTLQALLREKNLSRVAEQQALTQQAVSEHLKKLRQTFDDPLFIRQGSGMQATPFACALEGKLQVAIEALEQLLTPEQFSPQTSCATFTLSCTDFEQTSLLPQVIREIRKEAPNLQLAIKNLELDSLASDLKTGKVDLAITNPSLAPKHYPTQLLYAERYQCVAARTNQHASENMSLASIATIPQVVVSPSRGEFTGAINQWFNDQGYPRKVLLSFPTFSAAIATISVTETCGFVPARLLPDNRLKVIQLDTQVPGFDVIAVWHPRSSQDGLHQWMRDKLRALLGS